MEKLNSLFLQNSCYFENVGQGYWNHYEHVYSIKVNILHNFKDLV